MEPCLCIGCVLFNSPSRVYVWAIEQDSALGRKLSKSILWLTFTYISDASSTGTKTEERSGIHHLNDHFYDLLRLQVCLCGKNNCISKYILRISVWESSFFIQWNEIVHEFISGVQTPPSPMCFTHWSLHIQTTGMPPGCSFPLWHFHKHVLPRFCSTFLFFCIDQLRVLEPNGKLKAAYLHFM